MGLAEEEEGRVLQNPTEEPSMLQAIGTVNLDYAGDDQATSDTDGEAVLLPVEEMPGIGLMVGINPGNVL